MKGKLVVCIGMLVVAGGCAPAFQIKYAMNDSGVKCNVGKPYSVVVDVFDDVRPDGERTNKFSVLDRTLFTNDKLFKGSVAKGVSESVALHLDGNIELASVSVMDVADTVDNPSVYSDLEAQGVDILILGKLTHFSGYQENIHPVFVMFSVAGMLVDVMVNPKTVGGNVAYTDVQIIDVPTRAVLWQGNLEHKFTEQDRWYDGAPAYVLRALKQTNEQFVQTFKESVGKKLSVK